MFGGLKMKKETKYLLPNGKKIPINHNEPLNKIPKGFQRVSALIILNDKKSWDELIEFNENKLYLEKSIYDKRINLILSECMLKNGTYELYCKIREIDDGEMD